MICGNLEVFITDCNYMDQPDGEKTFGYNMIDGRIRLLELDEQACYPENHVKRKDL